MWCVCVGGAAGPILHISKLISRGFKYFSLEGLLKFPFQPIPSLHCLAGSGISYLSQR